MTAPKHSLQWIHPPRQARTQQSLERLLDSAEVLLRDKSFEDIHVNEIALRADTSVAAFYRRFHDKNALLYALHQRFSDAAIATANDALEATRWENSGIREILESIVPFLIEVLRSQESVQRAVYRLALSDEAMLEISMRLRRYVLGRLCELLLQRRDEIQHPDPEHAVPFALVQAGALLTEFYLTGMRDTTLLPSSDQRIAEEVVHSCCSYLLSHG